jgi:hypothetical protein
MGHKVRKTVSVHESTVKKAATGEAPNYSKKTRRKGSKNSPVVTTQAIHPMLIEWLRDNDKSISDAELITPTQMIVR